MVKFIYMVVSMTFVCYRVACSIKSRFIELYYSINTGELGQTNE